MAVVMFDVDGVLADFILGATATAAYLFPHAQVYSTSEQEKWDDFKGLTKEEMNAVWIDIKRDRFFWECLYSLEDSEVFYRISKLQHDVYFATNRLGINAKGQTENWLNYRGVSGSVVLTPYKGEFAKVVSADYAIDDKPGNAVSIQYMSPKTHTFILDQKYNQFDHEVVGTRVQRVKSVTEFLDYIDEREGK